MATVITYLLVSNPSDPEAVEAHPIIQEHGFERQLVEGLEESDSLSALKFVVASALEDSADLEGPCKNLSETFPKATVTFCQVEERFDQVEHLRSIVFIGGKWAGEIEHGYVFNVGT